MTDLVHKAGSAARLRRRAGAVAGQPALRPRSARAAARRLPRRGRLLGRTRRYRSGASILFSSPLPGNGSWERATEVAQSDVSGQAGAKIRRRRAPTNSELRHEHAADEQRVRHRDVAERRLSGDVGAQRRPPSQRPPAAAFHGRARRAASATYSATGTSSARRCTSNRAAEALLVQPAPERVAQQLAALRERDLRRSRQQLRIDAGGVGQRQHAHDGRVDARRRIEASGGTSSTRLDRRSATAASPQPAVVLGRRARAAMRSTTSFCSMKCWSSIASTALEQVEQDRRRDVVGQVADHAQRAARVAAASAREVDLQHVGLDHVAARACARSRAARSRSSSITVSRPQRCDQRLASARRGPGRSRPAPRPAADRSRARSHR